MLSSESELEPVPDQKGWESQPGGRRPVFYRMKVVKKIPSVDSTFSHKNWDFASLLVIRNKKVLKTNILFVTYCEICLNILVLLSASYMSSWTTPFLVNIFLKIDFQQRSSIWGIIPTRRFTIFQPVPALIQIKEPYCVVARLYINNTEAVSICKSFLIQLSDRAHSRYWHS